MKDDTLAMELLKEQRTNAKRWFVAFIVVLGLLFATIGGFIVYLSIPSEGSSTEVYSDTGSANYVGNNMDGVINNGGTSESD